MAAQPTKVYPVAGHFLHDVPHVTQEVETKAEAERLIATGAFTDNPRHPDRQPEPTGASTQEPTEQVGSSDSEE